MVRLLPYSFLPAFPDHIVQTQALESGYLSRLQNDPPKHSLPPLPLPLYKLTTKMLSQIVANPHLRIQLRGRHSVGKAANRDNSTQL